MKNGVFPGKVQQPPPDTKKWLLRFNILFWFVTMLVIPMTFMLLTLSWTTLLTLLLLGSSSKCIIMYNQEYWSLVPRPSLLFSMHH